MSAVTSKVRIYDLAKDLKIDTKRLIEEVRREGVDVSVPSNSISKELAGKIRQRYPRPPNPSPTVRVIRKLAPVTRAEVPQPVPPPKPAAPPEVAPAARVIRKLAPAP